MLQYVKAEIPSFPKVILILADRESIGLHYSEEDIPAHRLGAG